MKNDRKTIFNVIFSNIVEIFQINVSQLQTNSYAGIKYADYKQKVCPNDDTFEDFIEEFMKIFTDMYSEDTLYAAKDSLNECFRTLVQAKRNKGIKCENMLASGTYEDIRILLTEAFCATGDIEKIEKIHPIVHFDSQKLIPSKYFFGRDDLVDELLKELKWGQFYLQGIGGVGKTEIVKAVVNKITSNPIDADGADTDAIFLTDIYWLDFNNDTDKDGNDAFKEMVIKAVCPEEKIDDKNRALLYEKSIGLLLAKKGTTLLVIDNVEIVTEELKAFINRLSNIRLLVAGRPLMKLGGLKVVEITELSRDACKELFNAYCPYQESETSAVSQIIELADSHTVTIELFAKLIKKQEKTINEFLQVLIKTGFNFKFDGAQEEEVSSAHHLLAKEDRIIVQLAKLFDIIKLTSKEKDLLIQFSTVPNLKCATTTVKQWFSLSSANELESLSNAGWIKSEERGNNKKSWHIHSIIAAAVRFACADILYATCKPLIVNLTKIMEEYENCNSTKTNTNLLIQFSWSISDIFNDCFETIEDGLFLKSLADLYDKIGYRMRALEIGKMTEKVFENLVD